MTDRDKIIAAGTDGNIDIFGIFDFTEADGDRHGSADAACVTEGQYEALLGMVATQLGISYPAAARLFPSYRHDLKEDAVTVDNVLHSSSSASASSSSSVVSPSPSSRLPPLCAHLAREIGVAFHWPDLNARAIPDVRCCDVRDLPKGEPFPDAGCGPHLHCLHCLQQSLDMAAPSGRGVPPPIVADFRDADSLQAHYTEHRRRYAAYLHLLDDGVVENGEWEPDMASTANDLEVCEAAAEEEGRHVCFMASLGTVAYPVLVFYCAECDAFAPLLQLYPSFTGSGEAAAGSDAWVSKDEGVPIVLSRLLLSCHVLYLFDPNRFKMSPQYGAPSGPSRSADRPLDHLLFLYKPLLFDGEAEGAWIEEFESDAEGTYVAVVLPDASVAGTPPELLLRDRVVVSPDSSESFARRSATATPQPTQFSPVVMGFAMEWGTEACLQAKIEMALARSRECLLPSQQHTTEPSSIPTTRRDSDTTSMLQVTTRPVFILEKETWATAHVLYHRLLPADAKLPLSYVDAADDGIRVYDKYEIETPMPIPRNPISTDTHSANRTEEDTAVEREMDADAPAIDACPYSMQSRTIDFFVHMAALAKAMHELAVWRLRAEKGETKR